VNNLAQILGHFVIDNPPLCTGLVLLWFILGWSLTSLSIQNWTPWAILTKKYPLSSEFYGEWLNWQSITVGNFLLGANFRQLVSIGFSNTFLYLKIRPKFLFPFIKPVQIPWSAIQSIKETRFLWARYCVFAIKDGPNLMIYRSRAFNDYLAQNASLSTILLDFKSRQEIG
jgi:hypothetical protein